MKEKIILDLCGGTGSWSKPYHDAGYTVIVIDPAPYNPTLSGRMTVQEYLDNVYRAYNCYNVYGILAAPPCTEFASSGARWWSKKDPSLLNGAIDIVNYCLKIIEWFQPELKFWALENPVGRLRAMLPSLANKAGLKLEQPVLIFNPCDYGDPYTKKTLLWGKFNFPIRNPVVPTEGSKLWKNYGGKSWKTKMERSKTPIGFATAFFEANK